MLPHEARGDPLFLEAALWKVCIGTPWRDQSATFGNGNRQFRRFRRRATSGVLQRLCEAPSGDPDPESVLMGGAIVPVHQKAAGAQGGSAPIHWPCGGLTTRIVALVNALGHPVRFLLPPGQSHESKGVAQLGRNLLSGALLAEQVFGSDGLLRALPVRGATAVIPAKANRKEGRACYDREACTWRHRALAGPCFIRVTVAPGAAWCLTSKALQRLRIRILNHFCAHLVCCAVV